MDFCNLQAQYAEYKEEIDAAIGKVLDSARFVNGPEVAELEAALAEYVGAEAIACGSGSDALYLALSAVELEPGDEVLTSPFTFISAGEKIVQAGGIPKFADISECDFNLSPEAVAAAITPRTRVVMPVSLFGQTVDTERLREVVEAAERKFGTSIVVIEDGAQSFGATDREVRSGNLFPLTITSFYPSKPLGCYGEGGAVLTRNREWSARVRGLRNHGKVEGNHRLRRLGTNSRLDTLQAAVLLVKLRRFEGELVRRCGVAERYREGLMPLARAGAVILPEVQPGRTSVWAQYTVRIPETACGGTGREGVREELLRRGIPTAVHYSTPLHLHENFSFLGGKEGEYPVAEQLSKEVLSVPMSGALSLREQQQVIDALFDLLS